MTKIGYFGDQNKLFWYPYPNLAHINHLARAQKRLEAVHVESLLRCHPTITAITTTLRTIAGNTCGHVWQSSHQ